MRVLFHLHFGCWVDLVGCVGQLMFFCLNSPHFILNCFASISDLHQGQLTAAFHIHTTIDGRVGQSMPESTHTVTDGARRETQKPVLWVRLIWAVQPFLFHVICCHSHNRQDWKSVMKLKCVHFGLSYVISISNLCNKVKDCKKCKSWPIYATHTSFPSMMRGIQRTTDPGLCWTTLMVNTWTNMSSNNNWTHHRYSS